MCLAKISHDSVQELEVDGPGLVARAEEPSDEVGGELTPEEELNLKKLAFLNGSGVIAFLNSNFAQLENDNRYNA